MKKNYLIYGLVGLLVVGGLLFWVFSSNKDAGLEENQKITEKSVCEIDEIIFYYLDTCSWCQKVKKEGTLERLEELGVKVSRVNARTGIVRHQFQGVPTFVVDEKIYTGYKTFEELKGLLRCELQKEVTQEGLTSPGTSIDFEDLSPEKMRERIIEERDYAISQAVAAGDYKCCIHPPCTMCYMEANQWNNQTAGTCACDDLIAEGKEPCPQCEGMLCEESVSCGRDTDNFPGTDS